MRTIFLVMAFSTALSAQPPEAPQPQAPKTPQAAQTQKPRQVEAGQTQQDEYTRYELLAPQTASFKIDYEVTATTPGAKLFWNPIRKGSVARDEAVYDLMTGAPLKFEQVSGSQAHGHGLAGADPSMDFIDVHLARPIPRDGRQARLRIVKTYQDPKSYFREGDGIVFDRPLGIRRNAVVLPPGFYLTWLSMPAVIRQTKDGLTRLDFVNGRPDSLAVLIKARRVAGR